jgi:hypothetical protein
MAKMSKTEIGQQTSERTEVGDGALDTVRTKRSAAGTQQRDRTVLSNPAAGPAIDAQSSNTAKLELFRSLFGARADVYAVRWENASTGKSGWSPATRSGWSNQRRSRRDYLPLTNDVLASHLRGEATIGIYPLLRGDTCTLLACDFDKGSWVLDALAYLDACHAHGVPAAFERSLSGNGGHVWIFLETPVPASEVRGPCRPCGQLARESCGGCPSRSSANASVPPSAGPSGRIPRGHPRRSTDRVHRWCNHVLRPRPGRRGCPAALKVVTTRGLMSAPLVRLDDLVMARRQLLNFKRLAESGQSSDPNS